MGKEKGKKTAVTAIKSTSIRATITAITPKMVAMVKVKAEAVMVVLVAAPEAGRVAVWVRAWVAAKAGMGKTIAPTTITIRMPMVTSK